MIHPATRLAFINETIGYGVVATEFIPTGTVVWVRDPLDMVLEKPDVEALSPLYKPMIDRYAYECRAWVQASTDDYMRGWVDGYREWNTRVRGSECCGSR